MYTYTLIHICIINDTFIFKTIVPNLVHPSKITVFAYWGFKGALNWIPIFPVILATYEQFFL